MEITTVGLDLAKNVFQVHAINSAGKVVEEDAAPCADAKVFRGA